MFFILQYVFQKIVLFRFLVSDFVVPIEQTFRKKAERWQSLVRKSTEGKFEEEARKMRINKCVKVSKRKYRWSSQLHSF
ncbi:Protein CBG25321 [Caenorhabditis briggsae]|uniref:Protein CBG25321 n=1 Tax=Caenorhabditis briggsae TaxID=6238 RepID=B6IH19_CAEBR|nr:Protein CBG25321 [Caenorhabditis briggsae]CAR99199.1 Protein CBG25321 [Caenorhabditis briggsae]